MTTEKYGKVVKGLGGLYEVRLSDDGTRLACRAKGVLRRDEDKIYIGDNVTVTIDEDTPDGIVISKIEDRKNFLIRPPISNLDYLFIVFAPRLPPKESTIFSPSRKPSFLRAVSYESPPKPSRRGLPTCMTLCWLVSAN